MTGGLMQLVAYGAQDIYLTGNPQITFFKTVYRRYTNFATEAIELAFIGTTQFGKSSITRIIKSGDLINRIYLKVTVNSVDPNGSYFAWVRRLGHAMINEVDIDIGGTKIDRQYGVWLDIWYELARKGYHEIGYAHMIGDIPELTDYNTNIKEEYTLYVPLQFWFNRHVGLSIPLIAIQYNEIHITVNFNPAEMLAVRDRNFDISKISIKNASLLIDYVYLDTEERRRFAQVGHEYLIEQLQWNGLEKINESSKRYRLDFNHPTKELIWASQNKNYITGRSFVYYSNSKWDIIAGCKLILNSSLALYNDPSNLVGGIWIEVAPNTIQSVGKININNLFSSSVWVNNNSLILGDYGITDQIYAYITVDINGNININKVETSLTIRDFSIPTDSTGLIDTRFNSNDVIVYIHNNYGLLIDGTINPVHSGLLQLNGHDRFDKREGVWFNYVQPQMYHTNTPVDGINVYSFSIQPEEHQPSGTANLSRIDYTDLILWFNDPTYNNKVPQLDMYNNENKFWIFGVNYNILRIMSGLAGLAYTQN
jgi:hypothetical protein